ncbi:MAG: hypothetical protein JO041_10900, partial [Acidobacteria bacterium]|nr:hypothetical protein [Acidobacteriota bacterium]
ARRYQGLPRGRQQAVRNAVRDLRNLPSPERQQWLSSPEYRTRFTDNEREIIGQALEIRPGQPPE